MGIFKTELHRNPAVLADNGGHWRGLDDLEVATCAWLSCSTKSDFTRELDDRRRQRLRGVFSQIKPKGGVSFQSEVLPETSRFTMTTAMIQPNYP